MGYRSIRKSYQKYTLYFNIPLSNFLVRNHSKSNSNPSGNFHSKVLHTYRHTSRLKFFRNNVLTQNAEEHKNLETKHLTESNTFTCVSSSCVRGSKNVGKRYRRLFYSEVNVYLINQGLLDINFSSSFCLQNGYVTFISKYISTTARV